MGKGKELEFSEGPGGGKGEPPVPPRKRQSVLEKNKEPIFTKRFILNDSIYRFRSWRYKFR